MDKKLHGASHNFYKLNNNWLLKHVLMRYGLVTALQSYRYNQPFKGKCIADYTPTNVFDTLAGAKT